MECSMRPNRSDIHLSKEEESKIEDATREHFESLAPKRHAKPQRSEYSSTYTDSISQGDDNKGLIPEFLHFQNLNNHSQKLAYNESESREEFVETEYYKDLNGIDKQHHTTGTGFIKMDHTKEKPFHLGPDFATDNRTSCKGNPATNEWVPADANTATYVSDKPSRSDN